MNELELIDRIIPLLPQNEDTVVGPGDDCAVIKVGDEWQLLAVDQVISGVHYAPAVTTPTQVAEKLLKRNLSDIAAMGGVPHCALLTLAGNIRHDTWFLEFFQALAAAADRYGVAISGGDIASLPSGCPAETMVTTLTITGKITPDQLCLRKNARPGQAVFVTGKFGNSFSSGHHLDFTPRLEEAHFLVGGHYTDCMIDVSDGLLLDLQRIAIASDTGMELTTEMIPHRSGADLAGALGDGEDYELIFTVDPEHTNAMTRQWPFTTPLTMIGTVTKSHPGLVFDRKGANLSAQYRNGFKHLTDHEHKSNH